MKIPGYTIIKKINAGGMATVFLATQHSVGRTVALKIMKPSLDKDPEFHQRFQREANIIGQLSHPNIIPIYDIGRHEGFNYISMEFLPRGALDEKIKQGIAPEQALKIATGIAAALEQAHSKGYVHRDIKPENILFREDDSPVLTDFGIARTIKSKANMTQVGTVIGTPYYMSPEQAKGEPSDGRSDLYSLGVVLYEMLTGEKLFHADSSLAISVKHIHEQPPALPSELSGLQSLLDKLLAKTPELRFQSARELIEELKLLLEQPHFANSTGKLQVHPLFGKLGNLLIQDAKYIRNKSLQLFGRNTAHNSLPSHTIEIAAVSADNINHTQMATRITPAVAPLKSATTQNNKGIYGRSGIYVAAITALFFFGWQLVNGNEKPSAKEQWASITGESNAATTATLIPLTVHPIPKEAQVRILNIRDKYTPGLELPPGTYQLEISYPGYATKKKWIRLDERNAVVDIALQKPNQQRTNSKLPLPELVLIKAGDYLKGNPNTQSVKPTNIEKDFYIGRYEITFNEYDFFAIETNRALPDDNGWGRGERPVINISWDDAIAYINWLNKTTGKEYRLPTSAEWEYAARGNTTSSYWWGNNPEDAHERANCRFGCKTWWNSVFDNKTQVVGAFPPNDFGVHDTAGNVAEWTSDCADKIVAAQEQTACLKRQAHGGAFTSKVENIAAYSQIAVTATKARKNLGFRLVQEIPQARVIDEQPDTGGQPRRRNIFRELRDSIFNRDN